MDSDTVDPINLGNDREITILELVQTIERLIGRPLKVTYKPLPADDPARRRPDLTRARSLLGYEPRTSLEDGLRQTIAYFQKALGCGSERPSAARTAVV
jgi:nucleoside-diphosphate-sugar epimerase